MASNTANLPGGDQDCVSGAMILAASPGRQRGTNNIEPTRGRFPTKCCYAAGEAQCDIPSPGPTRCRPGSVPPGPEAQGPNQNSRQCSGSRPCSRGVLCGWGGGLGQPTHVGEIEPNRDEGREDEPH